MHEPGRWGHQPVLLDAVLDVFGDVRGKTIADGTLGRAGHALALQERGAVLVGCDRDMEAIAAARERLGPGAELHHAPFSRLADILGDRRVDGILLDLGVSSPQLDVAARGFSFRANGPLDMRMDTSTGITAAELLEQLDENELADVLYTLGEERQSRRVARAIKAALPLTTTTALAELVARVLPHERRIHPATRTFQALRIAVNRELEELDEALTALPKRLVPGGRIAVISFHSLEDRRVKQTFRTLAGEGAPVDLRGQPLVTPDYRLVERRARKGEDLDPNPRARSARLRSLERLP